MGNKTLKEKADSVKNIDEEVIRSNPEENGEAEGLEAQAAGGKKKSAVSRVLAILALSVLAALFSRRVVIIVTQQYTHVAGNIHTRNSWAIIIRQFEKSECAAA